MPNTDYLRFNVGSIDELIKEKLREQFPDVDYRGSSSNIISETISSVISLVLYQVNRNVANSNFDKTQSYNSLLNIVNQIGYTPTGWQAGSMFIDISSNETLPTGNFVIPRYSFIDTPSGRFSTTEDTFITNNGEDSLVASDVLVSKGSWIQSSLYTTNGVINEQIILSGASRIDHNNIHVYVRGEDGVYSQYERVSSLFTSRTDDKHFEARYGANGTYAIQFGDNINGCVPPTNSDVIIYYLSVGANNNTINEGGFTGTISKFPSNILDQFLVTNNSSVKGDYLTRTEEFFSVINTSSSIELVEPETIEEIKRNAPLAFRSQNRLVTKEDYENFVLSNFSSFVGDVRVLSNDEYLDEYIRYFYDLGLDNPELEARALYSQINFSSSCNFNNIYTFVIPKNGVFLNEIQKKLIVDRMGDTKTLTSQIIPIDPVYVNFSVATTGTDPVSIRDIDDSFIEITRSNVSNRSESDIRHDVNETIVEYFQEVGGSFGGSVNINDITNQILNIQGVGGVRTINGSTSVSGVNLYQYNISHTDSVLITQQTTQFGGIFVPRLEDAELLNKIVVI